MLRLDPLTPADLTTTLVLIQEVEGNPRLDLDWLEYRTFGDATCPPELLLLAHEGSQIVGYCFACIRDGRGIFKLFGVSEARRGRGIGTAMFDAIEFRLRERGISVAAVEGAAPNFCVPGVDLRRTETVSFLLHRGYDTDRVSRVDMEVDLLHADLETASEEARLAREGIAIRRALPEEIENVSQFALAHFSPAWWQEVADAARFAPPPLFVAWHEGRVVSFAAYDVGGPARFGPTGTHPAYRRRGIAGVLLKLCLRSIRDRGEKRAEIAWVGPIPFYRDVVNARIHRVYWLFRKTLADQHAGKASA